jgi:TolB protein
MKQIALVWILGLFAASGFAGELAGQKLLITSVRTANTEVFVVDPETGDAQNVSRSPKSEDRYPCWSPDGKRICFMSDREGTTNLWIANADGSQARRLNRTPAVCYMPSWQKTPRGERIVFGKHGEKPEMAGIKPDGTGEEIFGEGHDPTLSPDGKLITYTGHQDGGVTVFVMNHDGSNKRQVLKEISKVGATFPNWSPDSKEIVYSFPVGDALELFVIGVDGSNNRQLTHTGKICTPSAWAPDGKWISFRVTDERYWSNPEKMLKVYSEKPADKRPVWIVRPNGGDAHVIECLRFQCAIDGSRASWKPLSR